MSRNEGTDPPIAATKARDMHHTICIFVWYIIAMAGGIVWADSAAHGINRLDVIHAMEARPKILALFDRERSDHDQAT